MTTKTKLILGGVAVVWVSAAVIYDAKRDPAQKAWEEQIGEVHPTPPPTPLAAAQKACAEAMQEAQLACRYAVKKGDDLSLTSTVGEVRQQKEREDRCGELGEKALSVCAAAKALEPTPKPAKPKAHKS